MRSEPDRLEIVVEGEVSRLDSYLAERLELSRSRIEQLIAEGKVELNGKQPRKRDRPRPGDRIVVEVPPPEAATARPEDIPLDIVYQDPHLLVIDKPAGMVVHPAPGHPSGTLVNALLHGVSDLSGIGGVLRPGIVHRLDRDTSGLMIVAKHDRSHQALSDDLKRRRIHRRYLAAAWGHLAEDAITVDAPIGRSLLDRKRMGVVEAGRRAVTHFRRLERWTAADLVSAELETGRTHQIRVHLQHIGHPVVGDRTYGVGRERGFSGHSRGWAATLARKTPRQFLHATELRFTHPVTREELTFESPLPPDLLEVATWARTHPA
jgi:23S rRNA pseudouridine1911/1915/1917 synthase